MDFQTARNVLELPLKFTSHDLKKHYHKQSLKFHPDKNKNDINATEKFKDINTAYTMLTEYLKIEGEQIDNNDNYNNLLTKFLNIVISHAGKEKIINCLYEIINNYTDISNYAETVPFDVLTECYSFLQKYQKTLQLPDDIIEKLEIYIAEHKEDQSKTVHIIHPSLEDAIESNIYKLSHNNQTYFIPLWHEELVFDSVIVKCCPTLPCHISIDKDNNINVNIRTKIAGLINKTTLDVIIENRNYEINVHDLKIQKYQNYLFKKAGLPKINIDDIYDNSEKSDIIIRIELY